MILVGVGGNLSSAHGSPLETCKAAIGCLAAEGATVLARSSWYESAPVPASDQPWFVNGVLSVATSVPPPALLALLHAVEAAFGRERGAANAARTVDLDLLAYGAAVLPGPGLRLPHPRLQERAFVLWPLKEIAPDWRHPILGATAAELADRLPPGQVVRKMAGNA